MPRKERPPCIGMYGFEYECPTCEWARECREMDEAIEQAATRKGTHVRLTGKYKEKKYKPKTTR